MSQPNQPNVAADLVRIHSVITRGLDVSIDRSQAFAQAGFPDASTKVGFVNYVQSLASLLHAHHLMEDEQAFPYLRDLLPEMPFDLLTDQHRQMIPVLDEINSAVGGVATGSQPDQSLGDLNRALVRVNGMWGPHIQIEEEHFSIDKGAEMIDVNEHTRLAQLFAKFSLEHTGPDYLVIPFILYNLSPEERAIIAGAMPPMVTQELVPKAWKEKWAPMQPFLLS
jgi:hypothetical protein